MKDEGGRMNVDRQLPSSSFILHPSAFCSSSLNQNLPGIISIARDLNLPNIWRQWITAHTFSPFDYDNRILVRKKIV
jgi:hypothetical protein